tara:strand:- start:43399 stop:43878 length:480 start_codon:yes stop_codon:yes gene_type:complete
MPQHGQFRHIYAIDTGAAACYLDRASRQCYATGGKVIFLGIAMNHDRNSGIQLGLFHFYQVNDLNHGLCRNIFLIRIMHRRIRQVTGDEDIVHAVRHQVRARRVKGHNINELRTIGVTNVDHIKLRCLAITGHIRNIGFIANNVQSIGNTQGIQYRHYR